MRNLIDMKEKTLEAKNRLRGMLDAAEGRGMNRDEESRYKELEAEVRTLERELLDEERLQEEELRSGGIPLDSYYGTVESRGGPSGKPGREWRSLFPQGGGGEWRDSEEFLRVVFTGLHDPRLETRQFTGSENELGGFSMPWELTSWLMDRSLENEIVRPRATVYPMAWRVRRIPAWGVGRREEGYEADPWALFGGFRPVWLDELEEATDQTATLRTIDLVAHKLGLFAAASNEIAADGLDFEYQLKNAMLRAMSFTLDYYFLRGEGLAQGQPMGVLNCAELIEVPRQGANEVVYQDIVNMYSRLHPAACQKAVWVCSYETIPQLLTMTDESNHLIWNPPVREGVPGYLFGLPLLRTEKLPGLGNTGDILLADFTHYAVGIRKEMALDKSNAPGWHQDLMNYRVLLRCDGQGTWGSTVIPVEGENTLSWCVALDEETEGNS